MDFYKQVEMYNLFKVLTQVSSHSMAQPFFYRLSQRLAYRFKSVVFLLGIILWCSSCSLFQRSPDLSPVGNPSHERFLKGQSLAMTGEYEKALPFLNAAIVEQTKDTDEALLLLARCYDQLAQPEKAILTLTELLDRPINPVTELKAKTILVKNQAKTELDIKSSPNLKSLRGLINLAGDDKVLVLENLRWSMDYSCDQYCLGEIAFLREIQDEYLYIAENDERAGERAAGVLIEKYIFFAEFLEKDTFDENYKRKLNWALIDSIDKLMSMKPASLVLPRGEKPKTAQAAEEASGAPKPDEEGSQDAASEDAASEEEPSLSPLEYLYGELVKIQKGLVSRYDSIKSPN